MILNNINDFIDELIDKTTNKSAVWFQTYKPNEFKLELSSGNIFIRKTTNFEHSANQIEFSIFNENNELLSRIETENSNSEKLNELYTLAEESYHKLNDTITGMYRDLEANIVSVKVKKTTTEPSKNKWTRKISRLMNKGKGYHYV